MTKITQISQLIMVLFTALLSTQLYALQDHPRLMLNKAGVEEIRQNLGKLPLFDASLAQVKQEVDAEIASGIDTPVPKDYSGGYTHEQHKRNFLIAQKAGALYQILDDEVYANYVRDMLLQYEAMYKNLPVHPKERSYARGKLFWQCLNDSNWLLYMAQAYDAIYSWLPEAERELLNTSLFRPFADFISVENPQFYNRVHNHSTWGNAAVGMIGLVMDDEELIQRALYGIADDGLQTGLKDNDGGFIKVEGQKAGFLANLDEPFSPDGYYTEGPYYQRYAMYPFLAFAVAMHNVKPEQGVLQYKDKVLLKGVNALLNLSDANGDFFPLNDAQKGMSYFSRSLVSAVNIAYYYGGQNPQLLSIAENQNQVLLDQSGLAVAKAIHNGKAKPYSKKSINLRDGAKGDEGGVGILRYGNEDLSLVFKYAAQGLSHGHYDKLSYSLYDKGDEVIQDYGLVRFVNIEQKGGGNYLKENKSWAKQTVAHNTLVQNQTSHFNGQYKTGSQHHSQLQFFDASRNNIQIVSAKEDNAYPGTTMYRTMAIIKPQSLPHPLVIDLLKVDSISKKQYDLPLHYMGQILKTNFEYNTLAALKPLGDKNGYQHLYLEAVGQASTLSSQFNWLLNNKFYTLTAATSDSDKWLFTRLGANDPDFNLRRDPALILRRKDTADTVFASVIEPHGNYSPVSELSLNPVSSIASVDVIYSEDKYTAIEITMLTEKTIKLVIANQNLAVDTKHRLKLDGKRYKWQGPYYLIEE